MDFKIKEELSRLTRSVDIINRELSDLKKAFRRTTSETDLINEKLEKRLGSG